MDIFTDAKIPKVLGKWGFIMELIYCFTEPGVKEYIRFTQDVYQGDPLYKDSLTAILQMILYRRSVFCQAITAEPVMVKDGGRVLAVCTLITTDRLPGMLEMAFFEARPEAEEAVAMLVEAAKEKGRREGLASILVGLNGHVNYGLGFLTDHFSSEVCFGSNYNPPYYPAYFTAHHPIEYSMVSYLTDMRRFNLEREAKLLERVRKRFTFRHADLSRLKREVEIYTYLNNEAFAGHPFYFARTPEEDYELLKTFRYFIKGENLLIAEKDREPVGLMLWYPDFNQLVRPGGSIGAGTLLKSKLLPHRVNRFKIAEIAVLPKYQGSGAVVGLFHECMRLTKGRFDWCESSWIFEDNLKSRGFGISWADREYKHYKAYEIRV